MRLYYKDSISADSTQEREKNASFHVTENASEAMQVHCKPPMTIQASLSQSRDAAELSSAIYSHAVSPYSKIDPIDPEPSPIGKNPLLDPPPTFHTQLHMVGVIASVLFNCQFNTDELCNYAAQNSTMFAPSWCVSCAAPPLCHFDFAACAAKLIIHCGSISQFQPGKLRVSSTPTADAW